MQRIGVIAMGKAAGFYAEGVAEYARRMRRLCRFEVAQLDEERLDEHNASPRQVEAALRREGGRILAAVPKGSVLVALCVEGRRLDSEAFAAWLDGVAQSGAPAVAFAVGSSHGLDGAVKRAATLRLSLSAMTLPHQLARLVLVEQVYRALMIREGGKYHK
jgi:23S rRNA (pseudouridine1915-N3)-methyltransferase